MDKYIPYDDALRAIIDKYEPHHYEHHKKSVAIKSSTGRLKRDKEWALEYWTNRYNRAKDYSDIHWDADERHEHRDYIDAMAFAIKALEQFKEEK